MKPLEDFAIDCPMCPHVRHDGDCSDCSCKVGSQHICLAHRIIPAAFWASPDGSDLLLTCVSKPHTSGAHVCGDMWWDHDQSADVTIDTEARP